MGVSLKAVSSRSVEQPCMLSPVSQTPIMLSTLRCHGRISQGGDIAPTEKLWCVRPKVKNLA